MNKRNKRNIRFSLAGSVFDWINGIFLTLFSLVTLVPFLFVISSSFVTSKELVAKGMVLFPTEFTLAAYEYLFSTRLIPMSMLVTIFITVAGTLINMAFTILMAYPLSRKTLAGRDRIMMLVVFTMLFSGGIIPTFFVVKWLGLLNTYGAYWLPGAISAFNMILLKNFFQQLPAGLEESATIDGCNDMQILTRIVLPLSMPAIATFSLFYALGHWNAYFNAIMYITDDAKWPLQVWLRQIVILSSSSLGDSEFLSMVPPQTVQYAVVTLAIVPLLLVYPFIQKYFSQGMLLGSVKG